MKSYRPFISNHIEKEVARHIGKHMQNNDVYDNNWSRDNSPLKVHSGIAKSLDKGSQTPRILIGLSAAFELQDHYHTTKALGVFLRHQGKDFILDEVIPVLFYQL